MPGKRLGTRLGAISNELGKCEGTRQLDLDNPNWEHVVGLEGSFPVFLSFLSSLWSIVFSEGKSVDRCC